VTPSPILSIVIPIYNEEEILPFLIERLMGQMSRWKTACLDGPTDTHTHSVEIIFVNDGSTDRTGLLLESLVEGNDDVRIITLSRNFGHQAAVSAGIKYARGQAMIVMDADLQDPPELIDDMLKKWKEGFDVVYAVRKHREKGFLGNTIYKLYYRLKSVLSDFPVQKDAGDFCLLSRKITEVINSLPEKERYVRGLRAWVGFRQTELPFRREPRQQGRSKYPLSKLLRLAFQGITATSVKPLFLSGLFCGISLLAVIGIVLYSILSKLYYPANIMPKGWTSLMVTVAILNGFNLISIWLLSLYISRIYRETLGRPTYIVAHDSLEETQAHAFQK
jgi:glycosyltransferase involved in cell wall biosynthesis